MNKLLEDEDSADEEFWNQDAFAEEENDEKYESESEEADVFDADFDDDESSSDSEEVAVARERRRPALKAPERKAPPAARAAPRAKAVKPDPADLGGDLAFSFAGEKRTSKRSGVQAILRRSEEAREAAKAKPGPRRPSNAEPPRQLTQAEILAEAAATEIANLADLERLLSAEAAVLKKAERAKKSDGFLPAVRARSFRDSQSGEAVIRLELRHGAGMPPPLNERPTRQKTPPKCVVSGEKARYKDPATGLPFFDKVAFKELRRRNDCGELVQGKNAIDESMKVDQNQNNALPGVELFPGTPVDDVGGIGAPSGSGERPTPGNRVDAPNPAKRVKKTVSLNSV
jgi:vacuolar protein sorting-associated protein 72